MVSSGRVETPIQSCPGTIQEPRSPSRQGRGIVAAAGFRPAWWLPGPHLQTLWAALARPRPRLPLRWETVPLPDGDFLELAWVAGVGTGPVVLVLHGLEGSARSPYAAGLAARLAAAGLRPAVMHLRGCGRRPNRGPCLYHSGMTGDLRAVLARLAATGRPAAAAVGYSLGGNLLLKHLGEAGAAAGLHAAVAVSVPFELAACARRIRVGFSRVYERALLRHMRRSVRRRLACVPLPGIGAVRLRGLASLRAFDAAVTAPLHGFAGVDDYYARASCRPWLGRIRVPTLILHAADDPFVPPEAIPAPDELAPAVRLELAHRGGHVGFVAGASPLRPRWWLEGRILDFLLERLAGSS